jgi:TetR/AcrR family acrAB operon transcriptional repressor
MLATEKLGDTMVRKTKEDALITRNSILEAAAVLFAERGVSRTTLQHIATAAGVTRGAIYWHFEDKGALFNDLLESAKMPLEAAMQLLDRPDSADPLGDLQQYAECVFRLMVQDDKARQVFEIATLKLEYTQEMTAVRERRTLNQSDWLRRVESRIRIGIKNGQVRPDAKSRSVAVGMWVLVEGLIRNWLIAPEFNLVKLGGEVVATHLDGLRPVARGESARRPAGA